MPGLRDLDWQISYGPGDDRLNDFFIPALSASVRYDRSAGFFSSSMLAVAAAGVTRLIANGGKMRLLCGADLAEDDVEAIGRGHAQLEEMVASRMKVRLALPESDYIRNRVEALAWLVGTGQMEIRVVLPTDANGNPLPGSLAEAYYHPKEGIFTDAEGNQVAFNGSVNESATALEQNYETFMVFNSWDTAPHLKQVARRFERLWEGQEKGWRALSVPEAVRRELLKLRPSAAPLRDPLEPPPEKQPEPPADEPDPSERERIVFQFLRDAPRLLNAGRLGLSTCTVRPWPHQERVVREVVERFPQPFLLCDEVGLGKTIEAGLIIRQLVLSGRVRRALILVPKSVLKQWQEELYEKFALNIPRYDGQNFRDVFGREIRVEPDTNPWDGHPILLASSHLAKRRERQQQLAEARGWDLLVVDEAHHARRKDFLNRDQYRPNRLLELLAGTNTIPGLRDKTRGLLLLTATPMQIDPVEVWDLLKLLGLGGRWGAGEGNFLRYFEELQKPGAQVDWPFVLGLLRDHFDTGGEWDDGFCEVAEGKLGPAVWDQLRNLPTAPNPLAVVRQLPASGLEILKELARRHTPLRRYAHRNTRDLLREYRDQGLLRENVPDRAPRPVWIDMKHEEQDLYHRIEDYIRDHYQKYEAERKGLGFVMTVYRRRLTSSFHAIAESLRRRLAFLRGTLGLDQLVTEDDTDQDDLDNDAAEELFPSADAAACQQMLELCRGEADYVEDFLAKLEALGSDSKFEQLLTDLGEVMQRRDSVIVFTQYTDTMDYIRDGLREVYGSQVACYSGRGGERWQGGRWTPTPKEDIKTAFREHREIKILLCTESASEGLNLQTCGVLVNYDMPWNPMRVEQRIGRIDRIGQTYPCVWVRNYFYEGTVEADVYQRLDNRIGSFEHVVGELQPILARVARTIEGAAMAGKQQRERILAEGVDEINQAVRSAKDTGFNLDTLADGRVESPADEAPPVTLPELERTVVESVALRERFRPHPTIQGAHMLDWHGSEQGVTFNPVVFDEHPNTLRLLTFGSDLLEQVLEFVDPPAERTDAGKVLRCRVEGPLDRVGYFGALNPADPSARTLAALQQALDADGQPLGADGIAHHADAFLHAVACEAEEEARVVEALRRCQVSAAAEEIRQLLLYAAYIELAQDSAGGLFAQQSGTAVPGQAVSRLRRHGYPFAGALRSVPVDDLMPRTSDPLFQDLTKRTTDALRRRFDAVQSRLGEALQHYCKVVRGTGARPGQTGTPLAAPQLSLYRP